MNDERGLPKQPKTPIVSNPSVPGVLKDFNISIEEALASDDEFFQMVASTELELGVDQLELGEDPVEQDQDQDDGPPEWLQNGVWYTDMVEMYRARGRAHDARKAAESRG